MCTCPREQLSEGLVPSQDWSKPGIHHVTNSHRQQTHQEAFSGRCSHIWKNWTLPTTPVFFLKPITSSQLRQGKQIDETGNVVDLEISTRKTKAMYINTKPSTMGFTLDGILVELVEYFAYLCSLSTDIIEWERCQVHTGRSPGEGSLLQVPYYLESKQLLIIILMICLTTVSLDVQTSDLNF